MASYSFNKQGKAYKRPSSTAKMSHMGSAGKTQDDFYNSGMPGENPFMSMYQATISAQGAQRAQTSHGGRHKTPVARPSKAAHHGHHHNSAHRNAHSDAKLAGGHIKQEQGRKFGEYEHGENADALFAPGIWGESPCK